MITRETRVRVTDDTEAVPLVEALSRDNGLTWQVFIDDEPYCYESMQSPQYMQELVNQIAIEADENYALIHKY